MPDKRCRLNEAMFVPLPYEISFFIRFLYQLNKADLSLGNYLPDPARQIIIHDLDIAS